MNTGAFGENFPYTNFHELNMDWIIQIAKNFLDQYTSIQTVITDGESNLTELAERLENDLNQWYTTHSTDIANELADALTDIANALTASENALSAFSNQKIIDITESIPQDYSALSQKVQNLSFDDIAGTSILPGTNIIPMATVTDGKYATISNGALLISSNTNYVMYKIPVKANGLYYINNTARFGARVTAQEVAIGVTANNITNFATTDTTAYMYLSFAKPVAENLSVALLYETVNTETKYLNNQYYDQSAESLYGKGFYKVTGSLTAGSALRPSYPNPVNVKKNNHYLFRGKITSFNTINIGHGKTAYGSSYMELNGTDAIIHNIKDNDNPVVYTHGLTISNYLYIEINVKEYTADITIMSNGGQYIITDANWQGFSNERFFADTENSSLTDCVLVWSSGDYRKSAWLFGDSYISFDSPERWCYYLGENRDNILMNGFPGEDSNNSWRALRTGIQYYGKPKYIIWALGMNDGSDNGDTPSATWTYGINRMLDACDCACATPILATIPTVPSINHEAKNTWVRNSGYRYIDFAKAVGANSSGVWYTGMLSSDNVHPTALGAKALYYEAVMDAPELFFSNP